MWTYNQATGMLSCDGQARAVGYSGHEEGRNNPVLQDRPNIGPIPRGRWTIGARFDSQTHGPICMHLTPMAGTETFGRGGFLIHGDSVAHPGGASLGCVILPRTARIEIAASGDTELQVV